jgi:arylsulfatase A-like enzyme
MPKALFISWISTVSFLAFMLVDYTGMYLSRIIKARTFSLTQVSTGNDGLLFLYTAFFYCCAGVLAGLVANCLYFCWKAAKKNTPAPGIFSLSLCLGLNISMNSYVLLNAQGLPIIVKTVTAVAIFCATMWAGILLLRRLQRGLPTVLISVCLALETFWTVLRNTTGEIGYAWAIASAAAVFFACYTVAFSIAGKWFKTLLVFLVVIVPSLVLYECVYSNNGLDTKHKPKVVADRPNVVMIIMDTTRADHISCYGYHKKTTPQIDKLASASTIYKHAYSTSSWTLPSIASIFTGLYPGTHEANRSADGAFKLADRYLTLAEILSGSGYNTAGYVTCHLLSNSIGLQQGFQTFETVYYDYSFFLTQFSLGAFLNTFLRMDDYLIFKGYENLGTASQVNRRAIPWLKNNAEAGPFFLMLHYFDPHNPYSAFYSEDYKTKEYETIIKEYSGNDPNYTVGEFALTGKSLLGQHKMPPNLQNYLVDNYDREIQFLDEKIGEIFETLKQAGSYEDTIIIITADHGESFGEHDMSLHGMFLYNDNLHVPLIIKYPEGDLKAPAPQVVNYPVSLTGIVPTVLSYLNLPLPESLQGSPLDDAKNQILISQLFPGRGWKKASKKQQKKLEWFSYDMMSFIDGEYKLIKRFGSEDLLFNLKHDPLETENIINKNKTDTQRLNSLLKEHITALGLRQKDQKREALQLKTIEALRSLGYMD